MRAGNGGPTAVCALEDVSVCCVVCISGLIAAFQKHLQRNAAVLGPRSFGVFCIPGVECWQDWCARLLVHAGNASHSVGAAHFGDIIVMMLCVWLFSGISFCQARAMQTAIKRDPRCDISPVCAARFVLPSKLWSGVLACTAMLLHNCVICTQ